MGFLERGRDLESERDHFFFRQTFAAEFLRESGAGDEFHDQEIDAVLRIEIVDGGDVGMIQFREGQGFFAKALAGGFVAENAWGQNF